jgi:hypothetical protein
VKTGKKEVEINGKGSKIIGIKVDIKLTKNQRLQARFQV